MLTTTGYLILGNNSHELAKSKYPNCYKLKDGEFYIEQTLIKEYQDRDHAPSFFRSNKYYTTTSATSNSQLNETITNWKNNNLVLYRGMAGCHYSLSDMSYGQLRSEGNNDIPTMTMLGKSTRWLPTAEDVDTAKHATYGAKDEFTVDLSNEEIIPLGFVVRIKAGMKFKNLPVCWINSGEIVVQGPLSLGTYEMHSITWIDAEMQIHYPWPRQLQGYDLPPTRPFQPKDEEEITSWLNECRPWINRTPIHHQR